MYIKIITDIEHLKHRWRVAHDLITDFVSLDNFEGDTYWDSLTPLGALIELYEMIQEYLPENKKWPLISRGFIINTSDPNIKEALEEVGMRWGIIENSIQELIDFKIIEIHEIH